MTDIAIRVEKLSKRYKIGVAKHRHDTLRDQLADGLKALFRRNGRPPTGKGTIYALKDVSFEVREGEVVGIIGRNGAGKSTLLKILSRITEPSSGYAKIHGRVGSLLEVGTGFHPELTGRENIYLNGAILGMKKAEIYHKFDEIVAFADIEKFIDTPVKRYSSGMYVRLAFAVAAHLESEILLVDEVLAVGDVAFQKKCLGKIGDIVRKGRTVVFVSHNMGAVSSLTQQCLYLCNGQIVDYNETKKIIERYLMESVEFGNEAKRSIDFYRHNLCTDSPVRITDIFIENSREWLPAIVMGSDFAIHVRIQVLKQLDGSNLTIILKNVHGERVAVIFSWDHGFSLSLEPGEHIVRVRLNGLLLVPGRYFVDVGINQSTDTFAFDLIIDFPLFTVVNNGKVTQWLERPWGAVHWDNINWERLE